MQKLGRIVLDLISGILSILWQGWVFTVLWNWFLVPYYHLTVINVAEAMSIIFYVQVINRTQKNDRFDSFIYSLVGLIVGAIIHLFIYHSF